MSFRQDSCDSQTLQRYPYLKPTAGSHTNKTKKEMISSDRLHVSPSPIKKSQYQNHKGHQRFEPSCLPQSLKDNADNSGSHRIMIRQFELVEFTKKFAVEKADYEDRIDSLIRQRDTLKLNIMKLQAEVRQASHLISSRDQIESQELARQQKQIYELQAVKARYEGEMCAIRNENGRFYQQIEQLQLQVKGLIQQLNLQKNKSSQLDKIKLSMIDSNNKLSDQNQQLVQNAKFFEDTIVRLRGQLKQCQKGNIILKENIDNKEVQLQSIQISMKAMTAELKTKTLQFQISCMRVLMLSSALEMQHRKFMGNESSFSTPNSCMHSCSRPVYSAEEELRMNINIMHIQNEHLRQQFLLQKEKVLVSEQHLQQQISRLNEELRQKNRQMFELTIQQTRNQPSPYGIHMGKSFEEGIDASQINLTPTNGLRNGCINIVNLSDKCNQLQTDLSNMNERQCLQNMSSTNYGSCITCINSQKQINFYRLKCERIEQELQNKQAYIQQRQASYEDMAEQYEFIKGELAQHFAIKCESKRLANKVKMMQDVIKTLKIQNQQLKQLSHTIWQKDEQQKVYHRNELKKQLKDAVFAYEREKLLLTQNTDRLERQICDLRRKLQDQKQVNTTDTGCISSY